MADERQPRHAEERRGAVFRIVEAPAEAPERPAREQVSDLARERSLQLVAQQRLHGRFEVGNGEELPFPDDLFDLVYAHGVVQYTAHPRRLVDECRRVLKPGGEAIIQVYNRISWLNLLSKAMNVGLEHETAPVLMKYSAGEFSRLLDRFREVRLVPERFPVRSRLHGGWKGALYNNLFVGTFNALPRAMVRRFGWHLLAFCRK